MFQKHFSLPKCFMLCFFFWLKQIAVQGKPNSTASVKLFDVFTSPNGDDWRKEKKLLPKVSYDGSLSLCLILRNPSSSHCL